LSIAVLPRRQWLPLVTAAAIVLALLQGSCQAPRPPIAIHNLAEAYVRLTLQFAQHRPNLVEGWRGPDTWVPGPRVPVQTLRDSLNQLLLQAEDPRLGRLDSTETPRVGYLRGQLRALGLVARRLLGESLRVEEEVRLAFGVPLPPLDQRQIARSRAALDNELRGAGSIEERYRRFRRAFIVPADRFDGALDTALAICRERSAFLRLPADERIKIVFDPTIEWEAFARYLGDHLTVITFAARSGHDVAGLLHAVCHETYAGHHAQHVMIDDALARGRGWTEFELTPGFGPHLMIAEGAAEIGAELALPADVRRDAYARMLASAGLAPSEAARLARVETLASDLEPAVASIIARYLDNDASREATMDALAHEALVPAPERLLSFAERQRTTALAYRVGKAAVAEVIGKVPESDRWRRLRDLFTLRPFVLE
jgi:hypothetical protein